MKEVFFGDIIRQRRKDLKLTQEQLCQGICEPVTISRIENHKRPPSRRTAIALLQRLGLPEDNYFAFLSEDDMKIDALQKEIVSCNVRHERARGLEKLQELEKLVEDKNKVDGESEGKMTRQFILRSKVLLGKAEGPYSLDEQLDMLMDAIRMTVPRFDLKKITNFLYTLDEVKIINQIAKVYSDSGKHKKAVDIYSQLLEYIQDHYQNIQQSGGHLPLIAHNYAIELDICKRYEDAIEIAELGWQSCVKYGHYQNLPGVIATMAECYFFLGVKEKSMDLYKQAFHLYRAIDNKRAAERIKTEVKEYFNNDFVF